MKYFVENQKTIRRKWGMKQEAFNKFFELEEGLIGRIERKSTQRTPTIAYLIKLIAHTHISLNRLCNYHLSEDDIPDKPLTPMSHLNEPMSPIYGNEKTLELSTANLFDYRSLIQKVNQIETHNETMRKKIEELETLLHLHGIKSIKPTEGQ